MSRGRSIAWRSIAKVQLRGLSCGWATIAGGRWRCGWATIAWRADVAGGANVDCEANVAYGVHIDLVDLIFFNIGMA